MSCSRKNRNVTRPNSSPSMVTPSTASVSRVRTLFLRALSLWGEHIRILARSRWGGIWSSHEDGRCGRPPGVRAVKSFHQRHQMVAGQYLCGPLTGRQQFKLQQR